MDYRGDLLAENKHDLWVAAISLAFDAYNCPNGSREAELAFIKDLPEPLRFALVCFLYEAEINNGGIDLVFSCIGLLLPEVVAGLSYFGLDKQSQHLHEITRQLQFEEFPRSHTELMDRWDAWRTDDRAEYVRKFESEYAALEDESNMRSHVESRIRSELSCFFRTTSWLDN